MSAPIISEPQPATAKFSVKKLATIRQRILSLLLNNKALVDGILGRLGDREKLSDQQLLDQTAEIKSLLQDLHAADLADVLEALPQDERLALWRLVDNNTRGHTLIEASETVWDSLIEEMSDKDLLKAMRTLHVDEQAYLAEYLPRNLMGRLLTSLDPDQRARVREVIQYGRDSVGQMMDFELVTVRADVTLGTVQRYLRYRKSIPDATDKIFVIDRKNTLLGELPLTTILLYSPDILVANVMNSEPTTFQPEEKAEDAAGAFERYDLISAAVVDAKGKLMGRLTIEEIVDVVNEESDTNLRRIGGLSPEEDVFSPVGRAVRTRWSWLAINLCTAFIASRVIGLFEHTISQLVALAALMPIVAGIGGNTGNQTITMIVRALALHHIQLGNGNLSFLMMRELGVALINGLVWGGMMGIVTYLLYGDLAMGGVMTLAMMLNLVVAALMGVVIPMTMARLGRDPAIGSSVMITAITDTGGFFIFLGLATLFLV
ncbi:magnesium transporter [Yersinia ruckeri]|uniref:Magnesium transporter MgtE n=1 Tax=Yersinia ruckeri TaxID=29486 RepID=A0A085UAG8_YERRU|nr:magnesium transporter [Yersinia ruckeri]AKA37922.1 dihydroorotate dehydrogenase [Yersinia ruckeri]ARZ00231.1 divalent cation transport protein [Yersinia ruckeri]AUQ42344.1 magnesium transporter [Yersinia ruckeri]EEQ00192.1 Magnesium transporter [Yersinia ruckeri ATCC 29473]EKN3346303.1 magnesium transporter [Yersinia ruckeri]